MKKLLVLLLMLVTMNASGQWVQQNSGTTQTLVGFHFFNSNTGIVYGNNGIILRTTNAGVNWISFTNGITDNYTYMNFIDDNTGYITGNKNLLKTTNKGVNWETTYFSASTGFRTIAFFDLNTGYLFGQQCDNTYKTTNGGINWIQQCGNPPQYGASNYYCAIRINDTLILAGGSVTQQNQSPGASFFMANRNSIASGVASGIGTSISSILMAGNSGIGYAWKSGTNLKTTNYGISWTTIPSLFGGMSFYNENLGLYYIKQGNYYRISYSNNQGTMWIIKDSISYFNTIYKMKFVTPDIVVAVGDSGKIFRNSNYTIGIKTISENIPDKFALSQNYPNPFNPMCNVQFSMCNAGNVKLVVYDVQGREVQTLVNKRLQPGTYEVKFDGSMLNSGVYFYKLVTDGFTETKKMLMIK